MRLFFSIIIFSMSFSANSNDLFAQSRKEKIRTYYQIIAEQRDFIAECQAKTREAQIKEFGRILPKISGDCEWTSNGCPISLSKPVFPETAKRLKIFGVAEVEIVIDKTGKVVFAKAIRGKGIFYANAEKAALLSRFRPLILCEKEIWQKIIIRYNFLFIS